MAPLWQRDSQAGFVLARSFWQFVAAGSSARAISGKLTCTKVHANFLSLGCRKPYRKPLDRMYFAIPDNSSSGNEQFFYFECLVSAACVLPDFLLLLCFCVHCFLARGASKSRLCMHTHHVKTVCAMLILHPGTPCLHTHTGHLAYKLGRRGATNAKAI